MKDPAHPHVNPHHMDAAHPHVQTVPPDPALRKTLMFGVVGGIVVVGAVVAVMSSAVREVAVKNTGNTDVRVEYAWTANGKRATRDRQVAPGGPERYRGHGLGINLALGMLVLHAVAIGCTTGRVNHTNRESFPLWSLSSSRPVCQKQRR